MTERFYYYAEPDTFDGPYQQGQSKVTLPNGHAIETVVQADPANDFYEATEDNSPVPPYTNPGAVVLSFVGTVYDAAARVVEDARANDTQISLDDAYRRKIQELDAYHELVAISAFQHDVASLEFWVPNAMVADQSRDDYNGYLGTRGNDILFAAIQAGIDAGGGTNAEVAAFWNHLKTVQTGPVTGQYWSRDIKVFLYTRDDPPLRVVDSSNQTQWSGLITSAGTFSWQHRNARDRVYVDILAAYDAADWATLTGIDVSAPAYNWPPFYEGNLASDAGGSTTVNQMLARQ